MEPDECLSCGKIGSFTQVPEELIEERMKDDSDMDLELGIEEDMQSEMGIKKSKLGPNSKISKSAKPKLKKPKSPIRRKR